MSEPLPEVRRAAYALAVAWSEGDRTGAAAIVDGMVSDAGSDRAAVVALRDLAVALAVELSTERAMALWDAAQARGEPPPSNDLLSAAVAAEFRARLLP